MNTFWKLYAVAAVVVVVLFFAVFGNVFAQAAPIQCSALKPCSAFWSPNTEPDIKDYRLYIRLLPNAYTNPFLTIVHPQTAVAQAPFMAGIGVLVPGQYAMAVTARDQALNESPKSVEVLFEFVGPDLPPAPPVLHIIGVTIP